MTLKYILVIWSGLVINNAEAEIVGSACELAEAEGLGRTALNENSFLGSFSQDNLSHGNLLASPGNTLLLLLLCCAALGREATVVRIPHGKDWDLVVHSTRHLQSVGSGGLGL